MSRHSPSLPLQAGPVQTVRRRGMSKTARHGPRGAVIQAPQAGAGGAGGDGRGPRRGQRVGEVTLAPNLPPEPRGFVHLGQRGEIDNVIVPVRAQVCGALPGLVAVLQENGGSGLIRGPSSLVINPLPENSTAQARGLSKQGAADRTCLPCGQKRLSSNHQTDAPLYVRCLQCLHVNQ